MRVLFFGMRCAFSAPPLRALLEAGHDVCAVVAPGWPGAPPLLAMAARPGPERLPLAQRPAASPLDQIVEAEQLPFFVASNLAHPAALDQFAALRPDVIVVACFPRRIPASVLALARHGGLNVHPSLLPRWRGPDPLFWTFHEGDAIAGATVHQLTEAFDAGPVLAQESTTVRAGTRLPDLEATLAEMGGRLLATTLAQIAAGTARPEPQIGEPSWARSPQPGDFRLTTHWSAERAYRFVRGVAPVHGPLMVLIGDGRAEAVRDAIAIETASPASPHLIEGGGEAVVRFTDGMVRFLLADGS